jgi:hypothetical protein
MRIVGTGVVEKHQEPGGQSAHEETGDALDAPGCRQPARAPGAPLQRLLGGSVGGGRRLTNPLPPASPTGLDLRVKRGPSRSERMSSVEGAPTCHHGSTAEIGTLRRH